MISIHRLCHWMSPYADPSVVPSFKIANLISEQYKVAISGDGGDELLGVIIEFQIL